MPERPDAELRCPTCGARQRPTDICRRCKSDLSLLRDALDAYHAHRRDALAALDAGRIGAATSHARRCVELRPGPDSRRLLAVCRLLRGDWPEALDLARSDAAT